jgi:hypothetical protein
MYPILRLDGHFRDIRGVQVTIDDFSAQNFAEMPTCKQSSDDSAAAEV